MERIRVLLGNHPMMVPDALRQMITNQDDMELVGDVRGPMKILQRSANKADAIVLVKRQTKSQASAVSCWRSTQTSPL